MSQNPSQKEITDILNGIAFKNALNTKEVLNLDLDIDFVVDYMLYLTKFEIELKIKGPFRNNLGDYCFGQQGYMKEIDLSGNEIDFQSDGDFN